MTSGNTHFNGPISGRNVVAAPQAQTMHLHFNEKPEESPQPPFFLVPFPPDPDFIDCGIIDRIQEKCSTPASRIALVGLGGVGKSKLAIEYSYRLREKQPQTSFFWVHASNGARFEQDFQKIADLVKISGRDDPKANIFKLVNNWLQDERNGSWVLVLDSVDDDTFLSEPPPSASSHSSTSKQPPLSTFLPRSPLGSIILTTRSKPVAQRMVPDQSIIPVEPMSKSEALALIEKKLGIQTKSDNTQAGGSDSSQSDQIEMLQLIEALEFMPLAIIHAAGFIKNQAPRYSVQRYLKEFQKSDGKKIRLLNREVNDGLVYRDWEATNSILITWQITFDHIRQIRQSAADLISLMSFFDPNGIAENLLQTAERNPRALESDDRNSASDSDANEEFEDDLSVLRDYLLISVEKDATTFTMHRLVQLATQMWLETDGQIEKWKQQFIKILSVKFPTGDFEDWTTCQSLFSHVKLAISQQPIFQRPESDESLLQWALLLHNGAKYAWGKGNSSDMKSMLTKAMETRKSLLGMDNQDTLHSAALMGLFYILKGQWKEAEALQAQALEISRKTLGAEDSTTIEIMAGLASSYHYQGRWEEARVLQQQALDLGLRIHGERHPDTIAIKANLAYTYANQGRIQEAEKLEVQVLDARKVVLRENHPDTLIAMANLASTYQGQGRLQEAEALGFQALEIRKVILGTEHPDTLGSMSGLATTYRNQGRWSEAEVLGVPCLETRKRTLGPEHPRTLNALNDLALTYRMQGRVLEAEPLQKQVVEIQTKIRDAEHPHTLVAIGNLSLIYQDLGRFEEAEALRMRCYEISKKNHGLKHPDTILHMHRVASIFSDQGQWSKAEALQVEALEMGREVLGERHLHTLGIMTGLASTYGNQGQLQKAENFGIQALDMSIEVLGVEHPNTLTAMENLASIYQKQDRREVAEMFQVRCLESCKRKLGVKHPKTLSSMANLAIIRHSLGQEGAIDLMAECVDLQTQVLGVDHFKTRSSSDISMLWHTEKLRVRA